MPVRELLAASVASLACDAALAETSRVLDRSARVVRFNYPNDRWRGHVNYAHNF